MKFPNLQRRRAAPASPGPPPWCPCWRPAGRVPEHPLWKASAGPWTQPEGDGRGAECGPVPGTRRGVGAGGVGDRKGGPSPVADPRQGPLPPRRGGQVALGDAPEPLALCSPRPGCSVGAGPGTGPAHPGGCALAPRYAVEALPSLWWFTYVDVGHGVRVGLWHDSLGRVERPERLCLCGTPATAPW